MFAPPPPKVDFPFPAIARAFIFSMALLLLIMDLLIYYSGGTYRGEVSTEAVNNMSTAMYFSTCTYFRLVKC